MAETRERILDAGISLWRNQPPAALFAGLSVAKVAEAAGVTRSTFYSYWPSSADYLTDLAHHLVELDATNYPAIVAAWGRFPYPPNPSADVPRTIISDCSGHFEAAISEPTLGLRLGLLSRADDPEIAEILREIYRRAEDAQYGPLAASLEHWGRAIREPLDEEMFKIVFSAVLEGLAARYTVQPDRFPFDLYGYVVLPLLVMFTRRPDDDRTLHEIVDTLNSWSAIGLAEKLRERESFAQQEPERVSTFSLREITTTARRLLARAGFGQLSMSEIALVTGYPESRLLQFFGSRSGLAICLLFLNSYERYLAIPDDVVGLAKIRRLVEINTDELRRHPAIAQNVLMLLSGHAALPRLDLIDFDPRPIFDDTVRDAIERGELDGNIDPIHFSMMLQRVVLLEGSQDGLVTPSIDTIELILHGAGAAPAPSTH